MLRLLVIRAIAVVYLEVLHGIVLAVIETSMIPREVRIIARQDFLPDVMIVIVLPIPAGIKRDLIIDSRSLQEDMQAIHVLHATRIPEISAYLLVQPAMFAEKRMTNTMMLEDIAMIPMHVLHAILTGEQTIRFA
jgi:hypothetical protein